MVSRKKEGNIWTFVESLEGDKVVWMIVFMLTAASMLTISSSTSLLALQTGTTRGAIIKEQFLLSLGGLGIVIICYNIRNLEFFRKVSYFGFIISLILLSLLDLHINLSPVVRPIYTNQAYRSLMFFEKVPVHVFEVTKIFMIMYLSWAVQAYKKDSFPIANKLAKTRHFKFMGRDWAKKWFCIYLPILIICFMEVGGSMSSAVFLGVIMVVTILIGGIKATDLFKVGALAALLLGLAISVHFASGGKAFSHIGSALSRPFYNPEKELVEAKGTANFQAALDKARQPISAKIAISEGGLIGKGPGSSTQRYVVPVMFEDYMFAFIVEEYGIIFGAIVVIVLYCSLIARSSLIVRNCDNIFGKTAVAGLALLISGQAMLHIMVNVGLGPLTGQTLPMISHGNSSFLMFSIAFGVILSVSRNTSKKIEKATLAEEPILERDEIQSRLDDLYDADL